MEYTKYFRRTGRGSYVAAVGGHRCTVFMGPSGQWSFFFDGRRAPAWFIRADLAMAAALRRFVPPQPTPFYATSSSAGQQEAAHSHQEAP